MRRRTSQSRIHTLWVALSVVLSSLFTKPSLAAVVSSEIAIDPPSASTGPAPGDQSDPTIVSGAGGYLAVWVDSRGGIWGTRLSSSGSALDPDGIQISPTGATPAVAFDGTNFVVVWTDDRNSAAKSADVYGARVTPQGTVLDPSGIAIASTAASEGDPAIAVGKGEILVVWDASCSSCDSEIQGARIDASGSVLQTLTFDSSASSYESLPAVAFNGTDYALVWNEDAAILQGLMLGSDAGVVGTIPAITAGRGWPPPAVLATDGTGFLLAWFGYDDGGNYATQFTRLSATGAPLDGAGITLPGFQTGAPSVAFDGTEYLVSYTNKPIPSYTNPQYAPPCVGTLIATDGTILGTSPVAVCDGEIIDTFHPGYENAVASDGTGFFAVWDRPTSSASGSDLVGRHVGATGTMDPIGFVALGPTATSMPASAFDGQGYLIVWSDTRQDEGDIYGARVTATGQVLDPTGFPISTAPRLQSDPVVSFDGTNYLVAWTDTRSMKYAFGSDVYASRVSTAASVLDEIPIKTGGSSGQTRAVAFGSNAFLVSWTSITGTVFARRVGSDGRVLDASDLLLPSTSPDYQGFWSTPPRIGTVFTGSDFLAVGSKQVSTNIGTLWWYEIFGWHIDPSGGIADKNGFQISVTGVPQKGPTDPAVAFDGTNHLVAWVSNGDIDGARVSSGNVVLDPNGLVIAPASGAQTAPSLAFDGTDFVAVWNDARDSGGDVYAARVSQNGVLRDGIAGLAIASSNLVESGPTAATDTSGHTLIAYEIGTTTPEHIALRLLTNLPQGAACTSGNECAGARCVDGVCCDGACSGDCDVCAASLGAVKDGACTVFQAAQAVTCKTTYLCDGGSARCPTGCTNDAACAPGAYCASGGVCVPQKQAGQSCNDAAGQDCLGTGCRVCATGHCADGVCCDSACDSACDVCSAALGAAANGACSVAPAGYTGLPSCAPFKCDGRSKLCAGACQSNGDCSASTYCSAGSCVPDLDIGKPCDSAESCQSGYCVDGVCCDVACGGQCEACDVVDHAGTCTPVEGIPRGSREPCDPGDGSDVCSAQTCSSGSCKPVTGVACREAACEGDVLVTAASCDGSGVCPRVAKPCVPFACGNGACKTGACARDADCASGYRCEQNQCVQGATCDGDHTTTGVDGGVQDCTPYRCTNEGVCRTTCNSVADCVEGAACSAEGQCVTEAPVEAPKDSGCGCSSVGVESSRTGAASMAWLIAAIGVCRRRKRIRGATVALAAACVGCAPQPAEESRRSEPIQIHRAATAAAERTGLAFQATSTGWTGGAATYVAAVEADSLRVSARDATNGALTLRTERVHRGPRLLTTHAPSIGVTRDGGLALDRGGVSEHFLNRPQGVEQSWSFAARPAGDGNVVVRVEANGPPFLDQSSAGIRFGTRNGARMRYGAATWIDARGERTRIESRYTDRHIVLTVPARLIDGSAYPATLDPEISPEFELDPELATGPAFGPQIRPVFAFDGVNTLAVWNEPTSVKAFTTPIATGRLVAARMAADGTVLDPEGISILASDAARAPSLAFNGTEYLLVWEDWRNWEATGPDIYGARIKPDGAVLDPDGFLISNAVDWEVVPVVSADPDGFEVAWELQSAAASARRIQNDGQMTAPANLYRRCEPALAFNGTKTLLVTRTCVEGSYDPYDVSAAFVSTTGTLGSPFLVAYNSVPYAGWYTHPVIASDGANFLIAWYAIGAGAGEQAAIVSGAGSITATLSLSGALGYPDALSLAFDGTNYVGAATYKQPPSYTQGTLSAFRLAPNGSFLGSMIPVTSSVSVEASPWPHAKFAPPAITETDAGVVIGWADLRNDVTAPDIYGARLDGTGTPLDPNGFLISEGPNAQLWPAAAFDGQRYFVVWSDTRGDHKADVYGMHVDANGSTLDSAATPISTATEDQLHPAVAFDGTNFLVVWHDKRSAADAIYASRVSPTGTVLDEIAVSTAVYAHGDPAVAYGSGRYLVVWGDHGALVGTDGTLIGSGEIALPAGNAAASDGTDFLVVGPTVSARVASDGTVLDPTGLAIGGSAVAYGAGSYLVVRSSGDVFGRRVTPTGNVDASDIPISIQVRAQTAPAVSFDGNEFVIAWNDGSAGEALSGARLSGAGQLLDDAITGMPLSASGTAVGAPSVKSDAGGRSLVVYERSVPTQQADIAAHHVLGVILTNYETGHACTDGAQCSSGFCTDGICCGTACDAPCDVCAKSLGATADGTCTLAAASAQVVCGGTYVCSGTSVDCPTSCSSDDACASSAYCATPGLCVPQKKLGQSCNDAAGQDCLTGACRVCESGAGQCSDGVCCDAPCDGSCDVCRRALGSPRDGTCGPAPAGSRGSPDCGASECDGVSSSCAATCQTDLDCPAGAYCRASDSTCQPDQQNSAPCTRAEECLSGFCADGYCCDGGCYGQCEACDVTGYFGVCTALTGDPHGARPKCFVGDGVDACTREACAAGACAPVNGVPCHEASCENDVQTLAATCDGSGICPIKTQSCLPSSCEGTACRSGACTTDGECASGYRCDAGACVEGARCDGDHTVTPPNGSPHDCSPYRCTDQGTCRETCTSSADCIAGSACSADATCVAAVQAQAPSSGCACRFGVGVTDRGWAIFGLLIGVLGVRRRRWVGR